MGQCAEPLSRRKIRAIARFLWHHIKRIDGLYFPIVEFIEFDLPELDPHFDFELVDESDLDPGTYALTYPDRRLMVIRHDVYEGACRGDGRCRFTLAHELFHYLFHNKENLALARSKGVIPAYMDPEWQANTFAAELLVPYERVKGMTVDEIKEACGVSYQVAQIQKQYQP